MKRIVFVTAIIMSLASIGVQSMIILLDYESVPTYIIIIGSLIGIISSAIGIIGVVKKDTKRKT